jgi:hypothetical protein
MVVGEQTWLLLCDTSTTTREMSRVVVIAWRCAGIDMITSFNKTDEPELNGLLREFLKSFC